MSAVESVAVPAPAIRIRDKKRVLSSAFVGTTIEWYDFYLYGTAAALIFNTQFFPQSSAFAGVLASFATFAVGFFARPVGGILAGHLGDRIGRKALLVASLLTMGIASTGIGLLPNYESIGTLAVVGLVVLRLLQGLSAGAEWGGSALLSVEHAPRHLRGFFGSFTQVGSAAGMLLATSAFATTQLVMTAEQFQSFGWRIPFLASAVLVVIGLIIRLGVEDAPQFQQLKAEKNTAKAPIAEVLRYHRRSLLVAIGLRLAQPALFVVLTVYLLGYISSRRDDTTSGLTAVLVGSAVGLVSGPFWGWLSDRYGRRPIAIAGAIGIGIFVWPLFWFLDNGPLVLLPLVMILGMNVLHDSIYGPQAAWFAEQFPLHLRYSGVSFGYQVGTVLSGGLTPFIAAALLSVGGGQPWLICAYLTLLAALSTIAAFAAKDPARTYAKNNSAPDTF
ncbi:MFS transporter [Arthrobacter sp. H41]|uniref:MFS transporter n=1 Tax=Arthrobacter sp. H41 TaxID=1312978 RepID=UPI0004B41438|nr:MFS transporter [Arthrobacter sp. H41]